MKNQPIRQRRRTFTLLELLIVMAVIAILAALLLPALENGRRASRQTVCAGNQRQAVLLLAMYSVDAGSIDIMHWSRVLLEGGWVTERGMAVLRCPLWCFEGDTYRQVFGMRRIVGDVYFFNRTVRPSETVLLADSLRVGQTNPVLDGKQILAFYGDTGPYANKVHYRHRRRANAAFADGSVRSVEMPYLQERGCRYYVY